ncbi:MAG TPA: hypothetical protein VGM05_02730 [Planctomycetaceae bacterium]
MNTINRIVAIVSPRRPFFDWAKQFDDNGPRIDEMLPEDLRLACLLPIAEDPEASLHDKFVEIFEEQLVAWHRDASAWPKRRTYAIFREWFDVQLIDLVFDASDEPLEYDG